MKIQLAIGFLVSAAVAVSAATEGTDAVDETKLLRIPISKKKIIHGGPPIASLRRRAQYNEKLYIGDGSIYMVNVAIGTPPQNFELVLDTGSADLWVPGASCPSTMCPLAKFNESQSSTFKDINQVFNITYGIGSASGGFGMDTVSIGGAIIEQQQFGLTNQTQNILTNMQTLSGESYTPTISSADNVTSYSTDHRMDGIFGLGYPLITSPSTSYNPFFFNLKAQKKIDQNIFSVFLNKSESMDTLGEVIFGGIDKTKYQGPLTYLPLAKTTRISAGGRSDYGYWQVYGQGVGATVNGKTTLDAPFKETTQFVFDTGTTLSYLPMNVIEPLFAAAIGNTNLAYDSANNYFQIRCSMAQENITLQFMMSPSANVTDTPVVLNVAIADVISPMDSDYMSSASVCMIGIVPTTGQIFFGESILKSLYQVYDVDQNRIGIASAIGSDSFISGATGNDTSSNGGSSDGSNNSNSNSNGASSSAGERKQASILGGAVISACVLYAFNYLQ